MLNADKLIGLTCEFTVIGADGEGSNAKYIEDFMYFVPSWKAIRAGHLDYSSVEGVYAITIGSMGQQLAEVKNSKSYPLAPYWNVIAARSGGDSTYFMVGGNELPKGADLTKYFPDISHTEINCQMFIQEHHVYSDEYELFDFMEEGEARISLSCGHRSTVSPDEYEDFNQNQSFPYLRRGKKARRDIMDFEHYYQSDLVHDFYEGICLRVNVHSSRMWWRVMRLASVVIDFSHCMLYYPICPREIKVKCFSRLFTVVYSEVVSRHMHQAIYSRHDANMVEFTLMELFQVPESFTRGEEIWKSLSWAIKDVANVGTTKAISVQTFGRLVTAFEAIESYWYSNEFNIRYMAIGSPMSSSINAKKNIHLEKLLQNAASDYLISGQMKGVGDWAYAIKKVRNDFVHKSSDEFLTYYRECCDAGMYLHADITILHDSIATLCRFRLALMINGGRIIHASDYLSNCKIKRKMLNVGKNKFRRLLKGCHDMSVDLKQYDKRKWSQK